MQSLPLNKLVNNSKLLYSEHITHHINTGVSEIKKNYTLKDAGCALL
jgi:hypothetical protein